MKVSKGLFALILSACMSAAWAIESPLVMLEATTQEMINTLKREKTALKTDRKRTYAIVEEIVFPHVDFDSMTKIALGRKNWGEATPAQREEFSQEFTTLLVRTYATALADYENETIVYFPMRESWEDKSRVQVHAAAKVPGQEDIDLLYRLIRRDDQWKIYDISIAGVSFLQSFRAQFDSEISRRGLQAVIDDLAMRNQELLLHANDPDAGADTENAG